MRSSRWLLLMLIPALIISTGTISSLESLTDVNDSLAELMSAE